MTIRALSKLLLYVILTQSNLKLLHFFESKHPDFLAYRIFPLDLTFLWIRFTRRAKNFKLMSLYEASNKLSHAISANYMPTAHSYSFCLLAYGIWLISEYQSLNFTQACFFLWNYHCLLEYLFKPWK